MANLLETLEKNRAQLLAPKQDTAPAASETIQGLFRAKSGKSVGTSEYASTDLAEQQTLLGGRQQAQAQLAPVLQLQGIEQSQQQAATQQQTQQQLQQVETQKLGNQLRNRIETNQLLSDLERNRGTLDFEKDQAKLEEAGFRLRFQDQAYLDDLTRVGQERRYNDSREFEKAITEESFHQSNQLLEQQLGGKSVLSASDREFQAAMSQLSIDDILKVAELESAHTETMAGLERQAIQQGAKEASDRTKFQSKMDMYTGLASAAGTLAGSGAFTPSPAAPEVKTSPNSMGRTTAI